MKNSFSNQVSLLVSVLPFIAKEKCFALKGGTALNLFIRDLPRLSVDIDLAYMPVEDREISLKEIDQAMKRINAQIISVFKGAEVSQSFLPSTDKCIRLTVKHNATQIKIEVTPVLRGSINPPIIKSISPATEAEYGTVSMQLLSFEDLYGGKICAALDRQHPRDLFDVYYLLQNEGISEALKNTFIVYLLSHPRPIAELVVPRLKNIEALYEKEFLGMTMERVSLETLTLTRLDLIKKIHEKLSDDDRNFILSVKAGKPKWELFAYPEAQDLPAIKWKLHNLSKMSQEKRKIATIKLEKILKKRDN
ncbi:MAG: nucleotidyl transferase AbiEii/AbiGii toxin family protein [Helicobacteraceae bacterium]|nr:nucleotidyl transferase AbiEii/AbiGii toxin family protein [Helicobacteraceae bacterium]